MHTLELGRTGLRVSEVGFGGIPIQRVSDDDAVRIIRHCLDLGVTFLDTAFGYGTSEERIGRAIAGRREGLVLASKSPARDGATFREHLNVSLQRLGVRHIDLYQFHNISADEQLAEVLAPGGAMEAAREAKAAGRIGHIGVTSHSLELALKAVQTGLFETLMFPFNFIADEAIEKLLPLCRQTQTGFIVMKPMAGGMLENARVAFKYLRQFPDTVTIPGIERAEEIEEIIAIMQGPAELTAEERAEMDRLRQELGKRFCPRCGYCQPCPQNIDITTIMNLKSFMKRFPPERLYVGRWGDVVEQAKQCADCGECEGRCPYQLPIREIMRENIAIFDRQKAIYEAAAH